SLTAALAALLSDDENDAIADASTAAVTTPTSPGGNSPTMNWPNTASLGFPAPVTADSVNRPDCASAHSPRPTDRNKRNWARTTKPRVTGAAGAEWSDRAQR